jgi:4-aminobutyrate--pyruvate transaminase
LIAGLTAFSDHPLVGEIRGVGLIAALELVAPEGSEEEFTAGKIGGQMTPIMLRNGLVSRNMIDAMAFCPPMIISAAEVAKVLGIVEKSLEELTAAIA